MPTLDFRNTNSLWCSVLVETLVRAGVRQAVVSPGSRSTPLTMALAGHPDMEAIPVLDERSAGFFALGLAKQSGCPVVLVCTSGTAGANYFPAVIEAQESGVPLIVITADRPPEMRDCASGQTIDQQKLFGGHVNWHHELAVPEARLELLRCLRQTVRQACERARFPSAGPVHLNAPFRDPLPPIEDATARALKTENWERFFETGEEVKASSLEKASTWAANFPGTARGLIIVGAAQPDDPARWSEAVWRLSAHRGWPVLADALNPLRTHAPDGVNVITTYDTILRSPAKASTLRPDFVVCVENWPTSKVLREWLTAIDAPTVVVTESAQNRDALHGRTRHARGGIEFLAEAAKASSCAVEGKASSFATTWREAEARARAGLDAALATNPGFEGNVVARLARRLPEGTPLFIANSMPVRDAEYFWPASDRRLRVFVNRGANGIDGTLSTALGVAHGGQPAVLLTGDLSLLHDTNGFLSARHLRGSLTVVLVNNDGGGIFNHLPVAQFEPPFEKFWGTPQAVDFAKLCAAYGVEHTVVRDGEHLEALTSALPESGVRVLEVRTDRKRDAALRKRLFAEVAAWLG